VSLFTKDKLLSLSRPLSLALSLSPSLSRPLSLKALLARHLQIGHVSSLGEGGPRLTSYSERITLLLLLISRAHVTHVHTCLPVTHHILLLPNAPDTPSPHDTLPQTSLP